MLKFITKQIELDRQVFTIDILDELLDAEYIAFDFETTGLDVFTLSPVLLGLEYNRNVYIIDLLTYSKKEVYNKILPLKDKLWIAHNAKYDDKVFKHHFNIELTNKWCTQLASEVLYNGADISHSYKECLRRHFNIDISKEDVNYFINRDLSLPIRREELLYLQQDLIHLFPLYKRQKEIGEKKELLNCIEDLENKYIDVVSEMELTGVKVNDKKWKESTKNFENLVIKKEKELKESLTILNKKFNLFKIVKTKSKSKDTKQLSLFDNKDLISMSLVIDRFNPSSPVQVSSILKNIGVLTNGSSEQELETALHIIKDNDIRSFINTLLEYREYKKLVSTYGLSFLNNIHPITGNIHTEYSQCFTHTGRLSSSKPNLQNIPSLEEIRECFIPDSDEYVFVTLDMSGQELRIVASYSQDKLILDSLNKGLDLHSELTQVSYRIINNDPDLIINKKIKEHENLRTGHKRVLFGIIYGAGPSRIATVLNITKDIATKVYKALSKSLPGLMKYQEKIKEESLRKGHVRDNTVYNRIRYFRLWRKKDLEDHEIEKQGANFPIQATGASMMKEAGINILNYIKENKLDAKIKLQVHDEYVIQIRKDQQYLGEVFRKIMIDTGNKYLKGVTMESSMSINNFWQK